MPPVIYQRVKSGRYDFIRRVDFDGDWDTKNNWNNADGGDRRSYVYYDVKETASHFFVTYAWYYPRREAGKSNPFRRFTRHENDMGGLTVVVRKNAPRGRSVEMIMAANGSAMHEYSPQPRRPLVEQRGQLGRGDQVH